MAPDQSDIQLTNIDNTIDVINYTYPFLPTTWQPGFVPKDNYILMEMYKKEIQTLFGVTDMTLQGENPANVESGKALNALIDMQSDRYMMFAESWENIFIEISDITIRMHNQMPEIVKDDILYVGENFKKQIKWSDVDIDRDSFVIKRYPVSTLPNQPDARREAVFQLMQAQLINQQQAAKLLQMPDIESFYDYQDAQYEYTDMLISQCIDGQDAYPIPQMDMDFAEEEIRKALLHYSTMGLEDENISLLVDLLNRIEVIRSTKATMQQKIAQAQQEQMMEAQSAGVTPSFNSQTGRAVAPEPSNVTLQGALGGLR